MDLRSFFLDFEICAFVYDQAIVEGLKLNFENDLTDSIELVLEIFQARSVSEKLKESSARLFSPLL